MYLFAVDKMMGDTHIDPAMVLEVLAKNNAF
jgi:hypothetical protein